MAAADGPTVEGWIVEHWRSLPINPKWYAVPRLAKTAYAAIAALVVAGASTGAATVSPPSVTDRPSATGTGRSTGVSASLAPSEAAESSPRPPTALFVGDWAALRPRGSAARSFACRAAARRDWQCTVHVTTDPRAAWPTAADVVVVATSSRDDVAVVARWLKALPIGLRAAPLVIVGPVATGGSNRTLRQVSALRRFAAGRKLMFVDPVAEHWVTAATRSRYLSPDGTQLTTAGHAIIGGRLAVALAKVEPAL
ncbi:MAG TPA: hypothetical protein VHN80_23895 [Kineosporiaceae bacterium]|nr:hypothetical protein [Kineosporiaceae bacterium]